MSIAAPATEGLVGHPAGELTRALTALEVAALFACILLYIWRWQYTHPLLWIVLLALVIASHFVHHDTLRDLGLAPFHLRASAQTVLPLMLVFYIPMVIFGFKSGQLKFILPDGAAFSHLATYGSWCLFQQYLMQSFFNNRLMSVVRSRHLSSLLAAVMFGAAHIPNPVLIIATTVAGFIFAEVFARHRNIWPLALAQAVGGILVAALAPPALIHNMRVGPGYFFWGLR